MKRNKKRHIRLAVMPKLTVGVIITLVSVALSYWFVDSKCSQLGQEIRKHEQQFVALEKERVREAARWDEKKTPEKLERAMLQHGVAMNYPTASQVVRTDKAGRPVAGQLSLVRIGKVRHASEAVVSTGTNR